VERVFTPVRRNPVYWSWYLFNLGADLLFGFISFRLLQIHIVTYVTLDLSNYSIYYKITIYIYIYSVVKYINISLIELLKMTNE
jgi:hypothetical protein